MLKVKKQIHIPKVKKLKIVTKKKTIRTGDKIIVNTDPSIAHIVTGIHKGTIYTAILAPINIRYVSSNIDKAITLINETGRKFKIRKLELEIGCAITIPKLGKQVYLLLLDSNNKPFIANGNPKLKLHDRYINPNNNLNWDIKDITIIASKQRVNQYKHLYYANLN